jgi:iron complex outermembrane receptor protein
MFKRTKVSAGVLLALGGAVAATSMPAMAQDTQRVEVTGSRIKRADAEGALPVSVITREQLEASGSVTVAEFIRNSTFSSSGQFRPQSGSSAQSFAGVNLRGLGSARTLVLVDGKRVAKSPNVGDAVDMNSIPMAAVERIEILTDGASAVYGSDAIGGVVNVILRKDFQGVQVSYGETKPSVKGGDRKEMSAIIGTSGDKGRLIAGVSKTSRDIIFVRDYPWGYTPGASSYSNGFYQASEADGEFFPIFSNAAYRGTAGSCDYPDKGFYIQTSTGRCRYDFNLVAADEAATGALSIFARGEVKIGDNWSAYLAASNTRNTSFGRYAPVPDAILIDPNGVAAGLVNGGAGIPAGETVMLAHRFAAAGNRDTSTDGNLYDVTVGARGDIGRFTVDFGARRTTSKLVETGRGFIVKAIATQFINDGTYDFADPFNNDDSVLKAMTATTGRDSTWKQTDLYANATTELFKMGGGNAQLYMALESSRQTYADIYDSLSEAGQILGSSGSSAGGSRDVWAATAEMLFPVSKGLEASLAARYENYSDYGNDFSPKASIRYQPTSNITLRASVGKGFRAPSLPDLTQKPAFSADTVVDPRHCLADGGFTAAECETEEFQINGLRISNPELTSEKSTQFALGAVWDVTPGFSVKLDYWNIKIDGLISFVSAQEIVDRDNDDSPLAIPSGLSIRRDPTTGAIIQIVSGSTNEGTWKVSGLDFNAVYQHNLGGFGKFRTSSTGRRCSSPSSMASTRTASSATRSRVPHWAPPG